MSRMRLNDSTTAQSTGSTTMTSTTNSVGDTIAMPARASRRARLIRRARRARTRPRRRWEDATAGLVEAGLDLFDALLGLLERRGRVLAVDHRRDRVGERLLTAQGADERRLPL